MRRERDSVTTLLVRTSTIASIARQTRRSVSVTITRIPVLSQPLTRKSLVLSAPRLKGGDPRGSAVVMNGGVPARIIGLPRIATVTS